MKAEAIHGRTFSEDREALAALRSYIPFYNYSRIHSSLNYVSQRRMRNSGLDSRCQLRTYP